MRTFMLAILILLAAGGRSPAFSQDPAERKIYIGENAFIPRTMEIYVGDLVTWTNITPAEQRVVSADRVAVEDEQHRRIETPVFDSGTIPAGRYFDWTFVETGTFGYYSSRDPAVRGTVIVRPPVVR